MLIMWVRYFCEEVIQVKKWIYPWLITFILTMFTGCTSIEHSEEETIKQNVIESVTVNEKNKDTEVEKFCGEIKAHYIDVGQGDCEFIELPNGQTMLIDAGNSHNGSDIVNYIKNKGYSEINYVVATHPHADHIGGMAEVLNNFDVGVMYMPDKVHTSHTFENMLDAIEENSIKLHRAKSGDCVLDTNVLKIDILAPFGEENNLNNYSVVVKITYGTTVFLYMGDAEQEIERQLIYSDVDADVLKVGHHGSNTASIKTFIQTVSPTVSIISCGKGNQYGHPHSETMAMLHNNDSEIYRTDEVGTIVVTADENKKIFVDKKASEIKENAPPEEVEKFPVTSHVVEETETTTKSNYSIEVYKTKSGECYHRSGCSSLSKSKIPITIEYAQNIGLRPCKRCNPPG